MKKGTGIFKQIEETKIVCDQCGSDISIDELICYDAHWSDGYDSYGDDCDFCSLECMSKFLEANQNSIYFPPDSEDVTLELPVSSFKIILSKLSD